MIVKIESVPPIICYRLTRKCNLHCNFCFASEHCTDLSTAEVKKSILRLKECGMQEIRIGGGEPTVRQDLLEILKFCINQNLKVRISTNLYKIEKIYTDLICLPLKITTRVCLKI